MLIEKWEKILEKAKKIPSKFLEIGRWIMTQRSDLEHKKLQTREQSWETMNLILGKDGDRLD